MLSRFQTSSRAGREDVVLAVGLSETDQRLLAALSRGMSWRLTCAERLNQAVRKARVRAVRVVLCECDLAEGNWKLLFDRVRDLPHAPRFIVAARLADERLWVEVLNLGAYDVLITPFHIDELHRVVSFAVKNAAWQARAAAAGAAAAECASQ